MKYAVTVILTATAILVAGLLVYTMTMGEHEKVSSVMTESEVREFMSAGQRQEPICLTEESETPRRESERLEEARLAKESERAEEESRLAEELKQAEEESRLAEELKRAEEKARLAEESERAEEESWLAEESERAKEEARLAEESERAEKARRLEELKREALSRPAGAAVSESEAALLGTDAWFTVSSISDSVFARMEGKSYGEDCTVPRTELRYLKVLHYNRDGEIRIGELVCHKDLAKSLSDIFKKLYQAKYPIQSMRLVDDYGGDDLRSAAANNTSCFNFRVSAGMDTALSNHAFGRAIDVNPLYNPYVWTDEEGIPRCDPKEGEAYTNRDFSHPYKIEADDLCVRLFKEHGFRWGGDWKYEKDYMHFSMP